MSCPHCNGSHNKTPCPKRLTINGQYWRVIPLREFVRRYTACIHALNAGREDGREGLDRVAVFDPLDGLLPLSAMPYHGRMFVERGRKG